MRVKANILTSGISTILNSLIVPVYALFFVALYRPYGINELLDMSDTTFTFNVTILFCIVLVSVSLTRGCLYLIGRYKYVSRPLYAVWCLGEIIVSALFAALYITLVSDEPVPYFDAAGISSGILFSICIFPYSFLWLAFELYIRHDDNIPASDDVSLIRFYDEYRKLRFVIAPEALVFIKSDENYVQINYMHDARIKKFILRSSMRALEETMTKHGLVRCHRSYFVNPSFIKMIHRDHSGVIVAELKIGDCGNVPISRKYHDAITRLL